MGVEVRENPDSRRFEVLVDGTLGGFADYRTRDGVVTITHSQVERQFRGRGLGGELARQTLDTLRERGARVVPACPFFAAYVEQHPEYDDLVEAV
jgi:uncharacterized protein